MTSITTYVLASVGLVSVIAVIGVVTLSLRDELLRESVSYLVSLSAGALFGDAFLHLLPETAEASGFDAGTGLYVLAGIVLAFVVEYYIDWHHHHRVAGDARVDTVSYMILFGDGFHNVIDGMIIAISYTASVPVGIATTLAIVLHEIPQEMGDFGVLIYGGFSKTRALFYNFLTAIMAFAGAGVVLLVGSGIDQLLSALLPIAAGNFIYIAGSDILPKLREEEDSRRSVVQLAVFVAGIAVLYALARLEL